MKELKVIIGCYNKSHLRLKYPVEQGKYNLHVLANEPVSEINNLFKFINRITAMPVYCLTDRQFAYIRFINELKNLACLIL